MARRIHHLLADRLLLPDSAVLGIDHLAGVSSSPLIIFANHLSYADANLIEILLQRFGAAALADRLTATAGRKCSRAASDASRACVLGRFEYRRVVMDAIGLAIAEALLLSYRGVYGHSPRLPEASRALQDSRLKA